MEKGRVFNAINDNKDTIECEIIMSYLCEQNGNNYVFYTDNCYDSEGTLNLFASRYLGEDDGEMILEEITDDNEWNLLDKALEEAKDGLN